MRDGQDELILQAIQLFLTFERRDQIFVEESVVDGDACLRG